MRNVVRAAGGIRWPLCLNMELIRVRAVSYMRNFGGDFTNRRYKIYCPANGNSYICVRKIRYYLNDFSRDGYHMLSFTNTGYFAGFRIVNIEYGIEDYAIVEFI